MCDLNDGLNQFNKLGYELTFNEKCFIVFHDLRKICLLYSSRHLNGMITLYIQNELKSRLNTKCFLCKSVLG